MREEWPEAQLDCPLRARQVSLGELHAFFGSQQSLLRPSMKAFAMDRNRVFLAQGAGTWFHRRFRGGWETKAAKPGRLRGISVALQLAELAKREWPSAFFRTGVRSMGLWNITLKVD